MLILSWYNYNSNQNINDMPFLIFGEKKGNKNIIFQCQSFMQIILTKVTSDPVYFPIFLSLLITALCNRLFPVICESIEIEDGWFPADKTEKLCLEFKKKES